MIVAVTVVREITTRLVLGPVLILGGLYFIAMPFAFATMLHGDPEASVGWREYLGEVFTSGA